MSMMPAAIFGDDIFVGCHLYWVVFLTIGVPILQYCASGCHKCNVALLFVAIFTKIRLTIGPFSRSKSQVFIHKQNRFFSCDIEVVLSDKEVITMAAIASGVLENKARKERKKKL